MIQESLCRKILRYYDQVRKKTAPRKYTHADFKGLDSVSAEYLCLIFNNGAMMAKTIIEQNYMIRRLKILRFKKWLFRWKE